LFASSAVSAAPITTITAWRDAALTIPILQDQWINVAQPYVRFDAGGAAQGFSSALGAGPSCAAITVSGDPAVERLPVMSDGSGPSNWLHARAITAGGECGAASIFRFSIDRSPDRIATFGAYQFDGGPRITSGVWQSDRRPYFEWTPQAPSLSPIAGYSYALDGFPDGVVDTTGRNLQLRSDLGEGRTTFRIVAIDQAGNLGLPVEFVVAVDSIGDAITDLVALTAAGGSPIGSGVDQSDADPYLRWSVPTSSSPIVGYSYAINGIADGFTIETTSPHVQLGPLPRGHNVFSVRAIDAAGNAGPASSFDIVVGDSGGQPVPIPSTIALLLAGLAPMIGAVGRRRRAGDRSGSRTRAAPA